MGGATATFLTQTASKNQRRRNRLTPIDCKTPLAEKLTEVVTGTLHCAELFHCYTTMAAVLETHGQTSAELGILNSSLHLIKVCFFPVGSCKLAV